MLRRNLVVLLSLAALPLAAQSRREPWMLTVDERIELRTNAALAQARVRERGRMQVSTAQANAEERPIVDAFDGRTHPELFLPHQVFEELVSLAFVSAPRTGDVVRRGLKGAVARHGLPPDFFDRLQSITSVYTSDLWALRDAVASRRQQTGAARERGQKQLTLRNDDVCRSRADALAAARREFGRERLDRFLYEVIAVNMFSVADRLPDAALLRRAEGGCR